MQVMLHHTNFMSLSWNSWRHFHKGKEELALVLWHIQGVQAMQVLHISLQGQQNLSVSQQFWSKTRFSPSLAILNPLPKFLPTRMPNIPTLAKIDLIY